MTNYRRPRQRGFAASALLVALRCALQGRGGVCLVAGFAAAASPTSTSSSPANPTLPASLLTRIRMAMELTTTKSAQNITAAKEAVALWDEALENHVSSGGGDVTDGVVTPLPPAILAASLGLHASALTRTGNDKRAAKVYARALSSEMRPYLTPDSFRDICFGRAYALQRLMRYEEAVEQFLTVLKETNEGQRNGGRDDIGQAVYAAVTCALRMENWDKAIGILKEYLEGAENIETLNGRNIALFALMRHVEDRAARASPYTQELLKQALQCDPKSPLIWWLYRIIVRGDDVIDSSSEQVMQVDFLHLAALNQCPLDDPRLVHLDDKVLLHQLLSSSGDNVAFWPPGFVLPGEKDKLRKEGKEMKNTSQKWILKDRAGYGSHGNRVISLGEVLAEDNSATGKEDETLCQQIVHPPLLLQRRKFSLRVYIVCVGGICEGDEMQFYISCEGLAKLASDHYDFDICGERASTSNNVACDSSDKAFMTNSGLGEGEDATQLDFHELRKEFEKEGWSYDKLWEGIVDSTRSTLLAYRSNCKKEGSLDQKRGLCRVLFSKAKVPKILGLDFLVDNDEKSWLIEVNRFPGLEPRGSLDEAVKRKVVGDAWNLACQMAGMSPFINNGAVDANAKMIGGDRSSTSLKLLF